MIQLLHIFNRCVLPYGCCIEVLWVNATQCYIDNLVISFQHNWRCLRPDEITNNKTVTELGVTGFHGKFSVRGTHET